MITLTMLYLAQVIIFGKEGDVMLGTSTGGNSRNVLAAFISV